MENSILISSLDGVPVVSAPSSLESPASSKEPSIETVPANPPKLTNVENSEETPVYKKNNKELGAHDTATVQTVTTSQAADILEAMTDPGELATSTVVVDDKTHSNAEPTDNAEKMPEVHVSEPVALPIKSELETTAAVEPEISLLQAKEESYQTQPSTADQQEENGTAQAATAQPLALPSDQDLAARLTALLQEADLSMVTERSLRRTLEAEFGVELAAKKPLIRSEIEKFLAAQGDGEEQDDDEGGEEEEQEVSTGGGAGKKRRRGSGLSMGCRLSPELASFLGRETCARTEVVKLLWVYIKEKGLQDPSDKRRILLDEKLSTIFPGKSVTMFKMNKHLSKHCKVDDRDVGSDDGGDGGSDSEAEGIPKPKRPRSAAKSKSASRRKSGGASTGEKKPTGFNKPVRVSEALAAWCGQEEISRPQLTKFFYEYVKANDLYDPSNKQYVMADDTLKHLTGEARFRAFGFQGLLKQHFIKP